MSDLEQKKLSELRVVDLRLELEKRDIDCNGVKAILVKKLSKALVDEGHDPDKFLFNIDPKGGTPKKKKDENGKEPNEEQNSTVQEKKLDSKKEPEENIDEDEELTKLLQSDDKNDSVSEDKLEECDRENEKTSQEKSRESKIECKAAEEKKSNETGTRLSADESSGRINEEKIGNKVDEEKKEMESEKFGTKEEEINEDDRKDKEELDKDEHDKEDVEESMEEGECSKDEKEDDNEEICDEDIDEQNETKTIGSEKGMDDEIEIKLEDKSDINGLDAEDSIHLTIGEDEEKLMAGEDDLIEKKDVKEVRSSGRGSKKQESSSRKTGDPRHISPDKGIDEKGKKSNYKNLWVSGLSSITRATDLKQVFSKLGKVVAAKVVTNAKTPGARCYGFVTMATSEDAQNCIKGLNLTELHGRLISVEAVANKPNAASKKPEEKRKAESPHRRTDDKKRKKEPSETLVPPGTEESRAENGSNNTIEETPAEIPTPSTGRPASSTGGEGSEKGGSSRSSRRERERQENSRLRRPREPLHGEPGVLSFEQIKEERERQRRREKERAVREEERRRREERDRQRVIEIRQREEALRLEREREKIRIERERLERERVELLRMERERLDREKEELKRQQLKLEEARRSKRTLSSSRDAYDDRKRVAAESRRYEAEHVSSHSLRYPERGSSSSAPYRSSRDERERRGEESSHRTKSESSRISHRDRYEPPSKGEHRYGSESWMPVGSSSSSVSKSYGSHTGSSSGRDVGSSWVGMSSDRKGPDLPASHWSRSTAQSDRWVSSGSGGGAMVGSGTSGSRGSSGLLPHPVGPSNMIGGPMSMGSMSTYPQSAGDRFDAYKPMGSMIRKF